jgi:hypothetical protein
VKQVAAHAYLFALALSGGASAGVIDLPPVGRSFQNILSSNRALGNVWTAQDSHKLFGYSAGSYSASPQVSLASHSTELAQVSFSSVSSTPVTQNTVAAFPPSQGATAAGQQSGIGVPYRSAGNSYPGPRFCSVPAPLYVTVSGRITLSGTGLSGVAINVNGSQTFSTITDTFGNYSVSLTVSGSYTLSASLGGYSFNPLPVVITNPTTNQTQNFAATSVSGLDYYPVTPCRVADTRVATFPAGFGPPSMSGGSTRTFNILSSPCAAGIPGNVAAYSLNFTVVPPSGGPPANLTTWPATQPAMPNVSTLNYSGSVVANAAIVPAGTNGAIDVFVNYPTDVLLDIDGYFAPPLSTGLEFYPVTPCRIADTRTGAGFTGQFGPPTMQGGATRTFNIPASSCGIPSTASAYSLNFAVVPPGGGPAANLTTWPAGQSMPNVSTLNYSGSVVANAATVPAGANGAINVFVNYPTDVLFDTDGYFAPLLPSGLHFYPVNPCRIADTRVGAGFTGQFGPPTLIGGSTRTFNIPAASCGIPATAAAYSLNFTVVPVAGVPPSNLTAWPANQAAMPNVSTLDFSGSVAANAAIVPAGPNGAINVFVNYSTDALLDINGYFAP